MGGYGEREGEERVGEGGSADGTAALLSGSYMTENMRRIKMRNKMRRKMTRNKMGNKMRNKMRKKRRKKR